MGAHRRTEWRNVVGSIRLYGGIDEKTGPGREFFVRSPLRRLGTAAYTETLCPSQHLIACQSHESTCQRQADL